jgi:DNA invertase Pin-like site-specific DNA recombinase
MSTDQQEDSISQQHGALLPRCECEGVRVVREFADEGKFGGSMDGRDAFKVMLEFCQQQRRGGPGTATSTPP